MMSDNNKPAILYLEPKNDIVLEGPFNRLVRKSIVIENPRKVQHVAFKLKTTTPHLFLVRPSTGVLGPGEKVTVDVFLKPIVEDVGQNCPMFFIQAAVVLGGNIDLDKFWKTQNSAIWKAKIKCELIPHKSSEDHFRQASGTATVFQNMKEGTGKTKLLLQDERSELKKQNSISDNQDMAARRRESIMQGPHPRNTTGYFLFLMVLTIVASIVGAYYGMHSSDLVKELCTNLCMDQ